MTVLVACEYCGGVLEPAIIADTAAILTLADVPAPAAKPEIVPLPALDGRIYKKCLTGDLSIHQRPPGTPIPGPAHGTILSARHGC